VVGITDFAQAQLGEIVYVELPPKGTHLRAGGPFGTIESAKAVSELYAPVTGTVIASNDALDDEPETVNTSPYGDGWIARIQIEDRSEIATLLDAALYLAAAKEAH